MIFYSSDRGVSPVLGGILMFGLAMSLLILTQVSVVPAANNQVEFEHNQRVQDDFERFQASSSRVASSGAPETIDVEVGVRYPNRFFLLNPTPGSGVLNAEDATIDIANVQAINPETNDYFTSETNTLAYDTQRLIYEPNYKEYRNAPRTVHENGVTFNEYDGDVTLVTSATPFVNDGDITLILLDGDLYEEGTGSTSLTLQAASAPSQRIAVTNASAGPITIAFDTRLPQSEWDAFNATTSDVVDVQYDAVANTVTLTLDPTRDYTLRVARLTIGESAADRTPAYVTSVGTPPSSIPANSSITYTVEVRDVHHNPVSGGEVLARVTTGNAHFEPGSARTVERTVDVDENGRASVTVVGNPNEIGTVSVDVGRDANGDGTLTAAGDGAHNFAAHEFLLVTTSITQIDQVADVGGSINPNDANTGSLTLASTSALANGDGRLQFEKLGPNTKSVSELRVNFVSLDSQGNSPIDDFQTMTIVGVTNGGAPVTTDHNGSFDVGDTYTAVANGPIVVQSGDTLLVDFQFTGIVEGNGQQPNTTQTYDLQPGDFFIISVSFTDGTTATYFAGVV
jgi:uncharacterized protein (DUF2141 family)